MMHLTILALALCSVQPVEKAAGDSVPVVDIEEAVVVASPKLSEKIRRTSTSVSLFSDDGMQTRGVKSLSDLSAYAPNLYIPSYGSLQSSAVYIRGVGSRINTPAVAMYIDDVPVIEKSAYNLDLLDVSRIDVLRGPQGTLFGRNAMGGLIHVHTVNPFVTQGTDIRTGVASKDGKAYLSAMTHQKLSDKAAFSAGGFYERSGGYYRNDSLDKKIGGYQRFGGKTNWKLRPTDKWNLNLSAAYDYSDEDAYPYFYGGGTSGEEDLPNLLHRISANHEGNYRRHLFNSGFSARYDAPAFSVTSVTGYQFLDDRMMMDQDFLALDYYTLEQRQKSHVLTEEIILKSHSGRRLEWTGGVFGMWQAMRTTAPVVFYGDGMRMLNGNIAGGMPTISYPNPYSGQTVSMPLSLSISDPLMTVPSSFRTPVLSGAVFVQGTLHDALLERLDLTLGLRLDNERQKLTYASAVSNVHYVFSMPMISPANLEANVNKNGSFANTYTRLLPKVSLQYNLPDNQGNVYATVSEGMRAGGYNIQMVSDVMSSVLRGDMMDHTRDYCNTLLKDLAEKAASPAMAAMFNGIRQKMNESMPKIDIPDVQDAVTYKPEYAWNYELGTHLNLLENALMADFSVFFMDIHNQQLSRFAPTGLGRMMVNAGRSRNIGFELSLKGSLLNHRLHWGASYGYTHAELRNCDLGEGMDYKGNRVPFIPEHNVCLSADYDLAVSSGLLERIVLGADMTGLGRIYWTEANDTYQNFYILPNAHCTLDFGKLSLRLWGRNLSQTSFHTFEFETMNRNFYQKGMPLQLGVDIRLRF